VKATDRKQKQNNGGTDRHSPNLHTM